ncbi:hypothetical protein CGZ90_16985 [Fictibacillus aquaticus]|uniref:Uncharacterized protein n=1 Tax=Fictibacillus aquaticus TaxID=2021314 RepID=A0A235F6K8_9BACL|nr:hypothetical protein CGZ90_16985 [Fictibacillus aquaticus]
MIEFISSAIVINIAAIVYAVYRSIKREKASDFASKVPIPDHLKLQTKLNKPQNPVYYRVLLFLSSKSYFGGTVPSETTGGKKLCTVLRFSCFSSFLSRVRYLWRYF